MQTQARFILLPPLGLGAELRRPVDAHGLVVFAHGSGSSRFSSRNQAVARALVARGFATLLLDLLTEPEAALRENVFDIALLGERLVQAIDWAGAQPDLAQLPLGLFGASTGAGAALCAAAARPAAVQAVVSRGGRPDLAGEALAGVRAPTLLIVGGRDEPVVELNSRAMRQMSAPSVLEIVPGATHLFEEPGALDQVIELASAWYATYLRVDAASPG